MNAGTRWQVGVVGSLVGVVGLYVVLIRIAADPAALAHDERYYQHAINYDAEQAIAQRTSRLGWRVAVEATPVATVGPGAFVARVTDASGAPVEGATVRMTAFHLAHADRIAEARATAERDTYVAKLEAMRPGLWEVEIEIYRGTDRVREIARVDVGRVAVATR